MKKLLKTLCLFIIVLSQGSAQNNVAKIKKALSDIYYFSEVKNSPGNLDAIIETQYTTTKQDSLFIKKQKLSSLVTLFRKNGSISNQTVFMYKDGILTSKKKYTWDEKGNLIKDITCVPENGKDKIEDKTEFSYDNTGYKTKCVSTITGATWFIKKYNGAGKIAELKEVTLPDSAIIQYTNYKYNSTGRLSEENEYDSNHELITGYVFTYDTKGNITQCDHTFLSQSTTYNFDINGNITATRILSLDNPSADSYQFKYDVKGNLIEKNSLDASLSTLYKYDLDGAGNWIKRTEIEDEYFATITERMFYYPGDSLKLDEAIKKLNQNDLPVKEVKVNDKNQQPAVKIKSVDLLNAVNLNDTLGLRYYLKFDKKDEKEKALYWAISMGRYNCFKILLESKPNLDYTDGNRDAFIVHLAAGGNRNIILNRNQRFIQSDTLILMLNNLIAAGANPNKLGFTGQTALIEYVEDNKNQDIRVVEALLKAGVKTKTKAMFNHDVFDFTEFSSKEIKALIKEYRKNEQ